MKNLYRDFIIRGGYIRKLLITALFLISALLSSCGSDTGTSESDDPYEKSPEKSSEEKELVQPLGFNDITGIWELRYGTGYGYNFKFYKNYKSLIILYLKKSSIVFKGVYTLEETNNIRVNIFAMKFAGSLRDIYSSSGFTKTKRSYFIFKGHLKGRNGKRALVIKPEKIFIDGKSSHGYFEPLIKLILKKKFK
jgi:hypothetical protein